MVEAIWPVEADAGTGVKMLKEAGVLQTSDLARMCPLSEHISTAIRLSSSQNVVPVPAAAASPGSV